MPRFAPVTSATEPAALLGRGIATSATSGHPTRHYNYRSDKARWRAGMPERQARRCGREPRLRGRMRLTVVGCSGSMPGPHSPASCYLLEAEGFRLVVDLGNGAVGGLQRYSSLNRVDAVALSHLHADHCLDMCP